MTNCDEQRDRGGQKRWQRNGSKLAKVNDSQRAEAGEQNRGDQARRRQRSRDNRSPQESSGRLGFRPIDAACARMVRGSVGIDVGIHA